MGMAAAFAGGGEIEGSASESGETLISSRHPAGTQADLRD